MNWISVKRLPKRHGILIVWCKTLIDGKVEWEGFMEEYWRLPEKKKYVLCLIETTGWINPFIIQCHLNENNEFEDMLGNEPDGSWCPLYWRPLPPPPKGA
jgi:hypothetical protein